MQSTNFKAFLDMLAFSEGTSTSKYTKNNGYDIIVDGTDSPHVFTDYSDHPNILVTVNRSGLKSTAAGRYQQLYRYWPHYKASLNLPDFGPTSQDRLAIQLIREQGAYNLIISGSIRQAIAKCANIWASLPGAGYGQKEHDADTLVAKYQEFGGQVS